MEIFRRRNVEITEPEARGPMGLAKRDHIAAIVQLPRVSTAWSDHYGNAATDADVQSMYDEFLPLQKQTLSAHSEVIPGVCETMDLLRGQGIKIGSTTGYTRELMEVVIPLAASGGYEPDVVVCSDDVSAGRPAPWMNFRALEQLGVYPLDSVLVVDDTPIGIMAGLNSGSITVGVTKTGNALGLSASEVAKLPIDQLEARLDQIETEFRHAGADHVVQSVADIPELVDHLHSG